MRTQHSGTDRSIDAERASHGGYVHERAGHRLRVVYEDDGLLREAYIECLDCEETGRRPSDFDGVACEVER